MTPLQSTTHKKNKRVLVVTPTPTHPQNAGNRARVHTLLSHLSTCGYKVEVLYDGSESGAGHVGRQHDVAAMRKAWRQVYYVPNLLTASLWRFGRSEAVWWQRQVFRIACAVQQSHQHIVARILNIPDRCVGAIGRVLYRLFPRGYQKLKRYVPDGVLGVVSAMPRTTVHTGIDTWYPSRIDYVLRGLFQKYEYDVVLVEYVYYSRAFLCVPDGVHKILDTHDVFTGRNAQYKAQGITDSTFSTSAEEEARGLRRADGILAIQEQEASVLYALSGKPTFTVSHSVSEQHKVFHTRPRTLLFIGSANAGNIEAVQHLQRVLFPRIRARIPDTVLVLAGTVSRYAVPMDGVAIRGEVSVLRDLYDEIDIALNTVQLGSGLKIKTVEALGYGCPVVGTRHALVGVPCSAGVVVTSSDNAFVESVIGLLQDAKRYQALSKRATEYARQHNMLVLKQFQRALSHTTPTRGEYSGTHPTKTVLFSWPRCGASTLRNILNTSPGSSIAGEPFHHTRGTKLPEDDVMALETHLALLWEKHTGIKHNWGLTFTQNVHLLLHDTHAIVFLWRKNALQRALSLHIAQESNVWASNTAQRQNILQQTYSPVDIVRCRQDMETYLEDVARYRRLLEKSGRPYHELVYEELYDPNRGVADRMSMVNGMFAFLDYPMYSPAARERVMAYLDPLQRKVNTAETYTQIQNIEEIVRELAGDQFGRLE